jgi:hypothetical protein
MFTQQELNHMPLVKSMIFGETELNVEQAIKETGLRYSQIYRISNYLLELAKEEEKQRRKLREEDTTFIVGSFPDLPPLMGDIDNRAFVEMTPKVMTNADGRMCLVYESLINFE